MISVKIEEKFWRKFGEKLNENQLRIVYCMYINRDITINELSNRMSIGKRAIEKNISKLSDREIIRRVRGKKGGHWQVSIDKEES